MADQFYLIKDSLAQMGYEHYEISNYCLPSHQAKHNVSYWTGEKYLGLGASAHSYDGKIRKWNVSSIKEYIQSLQKGKILCESEEISPIMRHNEYILTHLRTKWGVKLAELEKMFGGQALLSLMENAKTPLSEGLLLIKNEAIVLSREGMLLADRLSSGLFME